MQFRWRLEKTTKTNGSLVHFLWYLGIATTLAALIAFTARLPEAWIWILCLLYAAIFSGLAVKILFDQQSQQVLVGVLVTAAIVSSTFGIVEGQKLFHVDYYEPIPDNYAMCGKDGDCVVHPSYNTLSILSRVLYSPLGPVLWATGASLVAVAIFRFLPAIVILTLGGWYLLFELIQPNASGFRPPLLFCGSITLLCSWLVDYHAEDNYGFWMNKLAMWSIALSLTLFLDKNGELLKLAYLTCNLLGMFFALYLRRPAGVLGFVVGAFGYLSHVYDFTSFGKLWIFPFLVGAIGAAIAYWGYNLSQNDRDLDNILPGWVVKLRPREHEESVIFGAEGLLERMGEH